MLKKLLGHKSINNTLLFTQLISFEGDEYDVKVAGKKQKILLNCLKLDLSGSEKTTRA
jgi:hypothetical protein